MGKNNNGNRNVQRYLVFHVLLLPVPVSSQLHGQQSNTLTFKRDLPILVPVMRLGGGDFPRNTLFLFVLTLIPSIKLT